jgi:hypothetical protein
MDRCNLAAECTDPACLRLHPCTGSNCRHYGKVWLPSDRFKRNINKRFKSCLGYARAHAQYNDQVRDRKRQHREESELAISPELDLSAEGKAAACVSALCSLQSAIASVRQQYPGREISCNVFGASTGSEGYSIVQEGEKSTLTERGYDTPAIVAPSSAVLRGWRALSGPERSGLGPPAAEIFDAGQSKEMSKHVEHQVQLHVEKMPGIQQLWRVAGAGGPKGLPPYCVGIRCIPHEEDGSLPHGFYHTIPRSEMASAAVPVDGDD